jgi:hypothetical protein
MSGLVAHRPLESTVADLFRREFSELFPRRIRFPEENDLLSFEFTSGLAEIVARYIIGLAAALSGDVDCAERMYEDLSRKLNREGKNFLVLEKVRDRLPRRMFEIHEARATAAYNVWRKDKTRDNARALGGHLSKIPLGATYARRVLTLRAVHAVAEHRDIKGARAFVNEHGNKEDAIWHFNHAFLDAYEGKLHKAIRHYRNGATCSMQEAATADVEEFMEWILKEEPKQYQFHYCLGFFNWKVRCDLALAKEDFNRFLQVGAKNQFQTERALAQKWIALIQEERSELRESMRTS